MSQTANAAAAATDRYRPTTYTVRYGLPYYVENDSKTLIDNPIVRTVRGCTPWSGADSILYAEGTLCLRFMFKECAYEIAGAAWAEVAEES